ncbi:MAG: glutathione peroxidase [Alphaproteobacteria bacterium]|nr:glutathione peroxidase [Alphaproteobacteria bacterium]
MSAHQFDFTAIDGAALPLRNYAGHAVPIVNTASECGFTRQYGALQALWRTYRDRGLIVLGIPGNDFGGQEPGSDADIKNFCDSEFAIEFPMSKRQSVIDADAHPFYRWIAAELGEDHAPKWNFRKYLLDTDGNLAGACPSRVGPDDAEIVAPIEDSLRG